MDRAYTVIIIEEKSVAHFCTNPYRLPDRTDLISYAKNNFELKMVDGINIAFEGSFKFKEKSLSLFLLKHAEGYSLTIERLEC